MMIALVLDGVHVADHCLVVALVHRCQIHKLRSVLEHLPERQRAWVRAILRRAYRSDQVAPARRLLQDSVRRLEDLSPSAAESLREGHRRDAHDPGPGALGAVAPVPGDNERRIEPYQSHAPCEAMEGFRRLEGYTDIPTLVAALRARDCQLGLVAQSEEQKIA